MIVRRTTGGRPRLLLAVLAGWLLAVNMSFGQTDGDRPGAKPASAGSPPPATRTAPVNDQAPADEKPVPVSELPATSGEPTIESIQAHLKRLETAKELEESARTMLQETYVKILQQLNQVAESQGRAASFQKIIEKAPDDLRQLKMEQAKVVPSTIARPISEETTLAQAQQSLAQAEARLLDWQKRQAELQNEPKRRTDRRVEISQLQEAAHRQLEELDKQLAVKPAANDVTEGATASRLLVLARQKAIREDMHAQQLELSAFEATAELLTAQRDQAVVQLAQAEESVKLWQEAVNERRRREAERQAREAEKATIQAHPAMKRLAEENSQLALARQEYAEKIERTLSETKRLTARTQKLDDQFAKVTERAQRVGFTETIGLLLRKHRDDLPSIRDHRREIASRNAEIANLSLHVLELEDQRSALADIDAAVKREINQLADSVNEAELPLIEDEIRELFQSRRDYLDSLIADSNSFQEKLLELNAREKHLVARAEEFKNYSDENVLWIRSTATPRTGDFAALVSAVQWLVDSDNWLEVADAIRADVGLNAWIYIGFIACCVLLATAHQLLRKRLREISEEASQGTSTRFILTVRALVLTFLLSAGWPAVMWIAGWRLGEIADRSEFVIAIAAALQGTAVLLFTLEFPRQVCRGHSLGESHFNWSPGSLRVIRHGLRWLAIGGLPAAFIVLLTEAQSDEAIKASLGRAAFVLGSLLLAWSAWRVWEAPRGLVQELISHEEDIRWKRFERFWHVSTVAAPVVLALMAIAGYYYTSVQLAWWMICTVWLLFGVVVVHAVLMRWLLLAYRELAIQRVRERRAAEMAAAAAAISDGKSPLVEAAIPEPAVSLSDVNLQTRNLLRIGMFATVFVGFWLIWAGVLPALGIFSRIELWPEAFKLHGTGISEEMASGGIITLGDVILAGVIALVTFTASRNIPGLLEITVLRRLSIDPGLRYAICTISKYVITVVGVLAASSQLGVGWSQVQWLVAGISVGLGFGLQEIFANFVSGLILLFERPIRIGDVVSVGDVTGKVSRIRIRATTITDGDLRELIVPNKEFITGRVMNWTLTDTTARMTFKFTVAYGSDPDQVRQLLLNVARQNPLVLKEPAPHALLDDLGDSAMVFTLRVFMTSLDVSLQVRHELHTSIVSALEAAGIEIPVPQRDLRIRSIEHPVQIESAIAEFNGNTGTRDG